MDASILAIMSPIASIHLIIAFVENGPGNRSLRVVALKISMFVNSRSISLIRYQPHYYPI